MRYYQFTNEDIGRRGFIKGAAAAAGLGTLGYGAVQQKQRGWDSSTVYSGDQLDSVSEPKKSSPEPTPINKEIPKYSPQQLESYLINYASKKLGSVEELIHFMAQVKTETDNFRSLIEYGGGNDRYHGGKDYLGRGFIHLTHKHNYEKYGNMVGVDLVNNPDLMLQPNIAAEVSIMSWKDYYWPTAKRLANKFKSLTAAVTKSVNGGLSKLKERKQNVDYYTKYFRQNPPSLTNTQK